MPEYRIRAVVFKEGDWWVAQCLEYRYAVPAKRLEDLPRELMRCLTWMIRLALEAGDEPFKGYTPAPRRYWKMFAHATPLPQTAPPSSEPDVELRIAA